MKIIPAGPEHFHEVIGLLRAAGLITSDLAADLDGFVVVVDDATFLATGGLELLGSPAAVGLIRSICVTPAVRGTGLGHRVYRHLEAQARSAGLSELYLLTETAEAFFRRLGYTSLGRDSAPQAVRDTAQFASLCPGEAAFMVKRLSAANA